MKRVRVDDFSDVSPWLPVASGQAELRLSSGVGERGAALRLDFDFKGGGGFVVARREIAFTLPEVYAFLFRVRGLAPANKFEFKLVDPSGKNVWRYQEESFAFSEEGRDLVLGPRALEFAWGPAGGGTVKRVGAIEFVIAAGPGGKGTVWIDDFFWEDRTNRRAPVILASSFVSRHEPKKILDKSVKTSWRPKASDRQPVLTLDFHQPREYGGLILDWEPSTQLRNFSVQSSADAKKWKTLQTTREGRGDRSYLYLLNSESRYLRLVFAKGKHASLGLRRLSVQPFDFSRSLTDFFHAVAHHEPKGSYPRYWLREQSYWTCAGVPDGTTSALINEEGLVEVDQGAFSLEPFLYSDDQLTTWADVRSTSELEDRTLPVPSVRWKGRGFDLQTTVFATGRGKSAVCWVRYRLKNATRRRCRGKLFVALRPFQVTPPWQSWKNLGGVSPIQDIRWQSSGVWINQKKVVVPLTKPHHFGAAAFAQGAITDYLRRGEVPKAKQIQDDFGWASAAMGFRFDLAPGKSQDIYLTVPFGISKKTSLAPLGALKRKKGEAEFTAATKQWSRRLGQVTFDLPKGVARDAAETFQTAAGQILINRDGPALQPGPRRYTRSWIRDGAIMGVALLRIGERRALRDFVRWYAPYQRKDGFVPCAVDRSGPDWLVEHDSHGQLIYAVMEDFRFSGDEAFLREMWPAMWKAAGFLETLRAQRLGLEYQIPEKRACYGLVPESASHEGYLAHPVHSYWDDFWAVRGCQETATAAAILGFEKEAAHFSALAESFRETLDASLRRVIAEKSLNYVPGSVEWADFDPTATANAVALLHAHLPIEPLNAMFETYLTDFRKKRRGTMPWTNYTAYEIRIIGALVRLGKRESALELLEFFLGDRRPLPWNQWPEISWRDPRSPGHLGDVPHTWISAEYMLAFSSLWAFEREAEGSLVLGAGLATAWMRAGASVNNLPTWYGLLDLSLKQSGTKTMEVQIGGTLRVPRAGFVVQPPLSGSIKNVQVNGRKHSEFTAKEVRLSEFPAEMVITYG